MNFKINNKWKCFLILCVGVLIPSLTFAQDQMFSPVKYDLSLNILSQMFGDLIAVASGNSIQEGSPFINKRMWLGTGLDPFQAVLKFFNMCCLFVGALLAVYSMVKGMLDTAHEGVFLGKELNNPAFWIRNGAGVALILPVFKGYCVLQVIVMWLIIQSVGIADTTWKAWFGFEDSTLGNAKGDEYGNVKSLYSLKMPSPEVASVVYRAFEGYTCLYGVASEKISDEIYSQEQQYVNSKYNEFEVLEKVDDIQTDGKYTIAVTTIRSDHNEVVEGEKTDGDIKTQSDKIIANWNKNEQDDVEKHAQKMKEAKGSAIQKLGNLASPYVNATEQTIQTGVVHFGVGDPGNNSTANNSACGVIDFTETGTPTNITNVAGVASESLKKYTNDNQNKPTGSYAGNGVDEKGEFIGKLRENKNKESNEIEILKIYKEVFNDRNKSISNLALKYVDEINRDVRFTDKPLDESERQKRIDQIRTKYMNQLDDIAHSFEQNMINRVQALHQEMQNKIDKTLNIEKSSITDLSSSNYGNYVDLMTLARRNAEADGWATAGMWYMTITNSIGQMHELMNISPGLKYVQVSDGQKLNALVGDLPSIPNFNAYQSIKHNYGFNNDHASFSSIKGVRLKNIPPSDTASAFAALGMGLDLNNLTDVGRHPVVILTESGHNLIDSAQRYMKYSSYWQQRNKKMIMDQEKKKPIPDPNDPSTQAHVMVSYFIGAIMVLGFMMAYYIPVLPFLIWIGALLGWIVSVVEAIFIAPLWGAMHLHPEGSKYTGKGNAGYALLTSLLLRPTLMILGLIASLVIVQVFGMTVNYIFSIGTTFSLQNNGGSNNMEMSKLMYVISVYAIYAIFMTGLITKMFNIITIVPDHILKWVGSQNGNLSEYGAIGGNETYGKLNALGGSAGNAYAQNLKGQGESVGMDDRQAEQAMSSGGDYTSDRNEVKGGNLTRRTDPNSDGTYGGTLRNPTGGAPTGGSPGVAPTGGIGGGISGSSLDNNISSSDPSSIDENNNALNVRGEPYKPGDQLPFNQANAQSVSAPTTPADQANHAAAYENAYKLGEDAGLHPEENSQIASTIADASYDDKSTQANLENWAKDRPGGVNVGERGEDGYMADKLRSIANNQVNNPSNDSSVMGNELANAVRNVSSDNKYEDGGIKIEKLYDNNTSGGGPKETKIM